MEQEQVPVRVLTELIAQQSHEIDHDGIDRELVVALQAAGYPPDAKHVAPADAVAILESLDAGIIRPRRSGESPAE